MTAMTLAQQIEAASVDFSDLDKRYRPLLRLVEQMIGIVPNCDPYLEIWPTGFRTYNLLVPNFLNMPQAVFGQGAPKDLVGLAMYVSSRAAECMYCSAHTCSFALRRGTSPDALIGDYNDVEAAVARVAEGMSRVPADLNKADIEILRSHLDEADVDWIVLSVALMGFLNKFMDTMGIELEQGAIDDVADLISETGWTTGRHNWSENLDDDFGFATGRPLAPSAGQPLPPADGSANGSASTNGSVNGTGEGPSFRDVPKDSLGTYLRMLRSTPAALRQGLIWTKGMSGRPTQALLLLEEQLGHAHPGLAYLGQPRAVKSLATVLRDNLDPEQTEIGLQAKCLMALVYARVVGDETLAAEAVQLADRLAPEIGPRRLAAIGRFASADMASAALPPGLSRVDAAAVLLAKAAAPSPCEVNALTVATTCEALTPAQIVEAVTWISLQQTLHRLNVFHDVDRAGHDEEPTGHGAGDLPAPAPAPRVNGGHLVTRRSPAPAPTPTRP